MLWMHSQMPKKNSAYFSNNIYYSKIIGSVTAAGVTKSENKICAVRCLWRIFKIYKSIYQWFDVYNLSFWNSEYKYIIKIMDNG